jgi:hypothetical protein
MNITGLLFLILAHYITGRGVLKLFRFQDNPVSVVCLAFIVSVPMLSFVPCAVQLMHLGINRKNISIGIAIMTALAAIPLLVNFKRPRLPRLSLPPIYEVPFLIIFLLHLLVSVWRCFYLPPTARDMLSGPEVLAEFAVREGTMLSSVFSIDLQTSNNYFKSPYITCLQIIYKLLVQPFGQIWLSILSIAFMVWVYTLVRKRLHPLIAAVVYLVFLIEPEFYAYTYLILYDFSNTVFFFCGFYFLTRYFEKKAISDFAFATFCFGIATYIRTETLILVCMIAPLLAMYFYRWKLPLKTAALRIIAFGLVPAFFYVLCIHVFVRNFVIVPFDLGSQVNQNLSDIQPFFNRLKDMAADLIFSTKGMYLYGFMLFVFCFILALDILFIRRFNHEARIMLYGVAVVYIGLGVIGYLLPLADLANTTKRGIFKMLPITLLYLANSPVLLRLSGYIRNWETRQPGDKSTVKPARPAVRPAPVPRQAPPQQKIKKRR